MKKKISVAALALALCFVAFSSYVSADEFTHAEVETVEVSKDELVQPERAALVQGLKFWGKEALKMFLNNGGLGGGSSIDSAELQSSLESAFD